MTNKKLISILDENSVLKKIVLNFYFKNLFFILTTKFAVAFQKLFSKLDCNNNTSVLFDIHIQQFFYVAFDHDYYIWYKLFFMSYQQQWFFYLLGYVDLLGAVFLTKYTFKCLHIYEL